MAEGRWCDEHRTWTNDNADFGCGCGSNEVDRLRAALEKLRHCSHACVPPCPHSRKFEEATRGVLPPRRVKSREPWEVQ